MARWSVTLKILAISIFFITILGLFMSGLLNSDDAEIRAYEKFLKESEEKRHKMELARSKASLSKGRLNNVPVMKPIDSEKPHDWDVQFISGKEMVKLVDGEHKPIQIHTITIQNFMEKDVLVQCRDPFAKLSQIISVGGFYEFSVTDIFHKRHYWCTVHHDKLVYSFLAYGEGAPRDNNVITLRLEGAFINGKNMTKQEVVT